MLQPGDGYFDRVGSRDGAKAEDSFNAAIGIRRSLLHGKPGTDQPVTRGDPECHLCTRKGIAVLISYFNNEGTIQRLTGCALLIVSRDFHYHLGTGARPLGDVPNPDDSSPGSRCQGRAIG